MPEYLKFSSRSEFRNWLETNCMSSEGVWLLFGKAGGPKTIKAGEALEEALCYGWIDGQMQSLDDKSYVKYFSMRRENSKCRKKIEAAKKNGQWDKPKAPPITDEQIAVLADILKEYEPAYTNFQAMSPSVKKTYTRAYYDAKTEAGRVNRISWMVERLNKNLKPM